MNETTRTPKGTAFLALLTLSLVAGLEAKAASVADGGEPAREAPRAQTVKLTTAAVKGRVFEGAKPIEAVKVYAYEVASFALRKVLSDEAGHFSFKSLPAGMYQIVAHKDGFAPSVELLLRKSPDTHQFVEIRLQEESPDDMRQAEDYWSVRSRVPADVLRDINSSAHDLDSAFGPGLLLRDDSQFAGQMLANSGLEQLGGGHGDAQLTTAQVDLLGAVGDVKVSLNGTLQQLAQRPDAGTTFVPDGEARSMALKVQGNDDSKLSVTTANGQLASLRGEELLPVDLETYQLRWSGQAGDKGRTEISAQYMEETNFHQAGWLDPINFSGASQLWNLEGAYDGELNENTTLRAGVSYRQRSRELAEDPFSTHGFGDKSLLDPSLLPGTTVNEDQAIDAYGIAGSKIQPRILVEYGLFSSVRDGSLSLMPHGGMVVELGNAWRAETGLSHRIERDSDIQNTYDGFETAFFGDSSSCQRSGESCYEVKFAKKGTAGDSFSIGAVHRKFAETLRLYFSPDFFHRLESVFVVEGDTVPEVQFSLVRRIAPRVLAKLESNFASGGGGIFYATDDLAYENEVRYLVTSLDTRFQSTATGIFVAFHHLEQALNPVAERKPASEVEMQRLQVMLTQDLSALADFAANWAVRFNVELSRGSSPYTLTEDDELRKKLTGGISVSF